MSIAASDIDYLRDLVARHSGNVIAPRQVYLLEQRLAPVAQDIGLEDVGALVAELRRSSDAGLSTQVAEAVTVNETSFFRDMHLFETLGKSILPELILKNSARKEIRIWSAACSSGQEPLSIAMVIRESFPHFSDWKFQIVATDLSKEMIQKARVAEFSQMEINRGLPMKQLVRFFHRNGETWQAKDELRNIIEHRHLNLTHEWPFMGQFDIILIRNVLIYFDQQTKAGILSRIHRALRPDGYLFIGAAETTIGLGVPFKRQEINGTVSYRPTNE